MKVGADVQNFYSNTKNGFGENTTFAGNFLTVTGQ